MMGSMAQGLIAVAVALGLHLGLFALRSDPGGAMSSGGGGQDLISLEAADASVAAMIRDWDTPPEVVAPLDPLQPQQPEALADQPDLSPGPDLAPDLPRLPQMAAQTAADPVPRIVETPPAPAIVPEAPVAPDKPKRPEPRPRAKPAKPAPQPDVAVKPPAAAQPAQAAQGAGGGAQAGERGTAQTATLSKSKVEDLKAGWGASIRSRIERKKRYPADAGGKAGRVTIRLTVARSGSLINAAVTQSSGNAALDAAALTAVQGAGKFPAAPKGLTNESYSFSLAMTFKR